ncbi:MAG: hypothetical protein HYZ53_21910 [Planctomycetes bacterium]|nr:hypothetical protein [Planctomycetota bacterium]
MIDLVALITLGERGTLRVRIINRSHSRWTVNSRLAVTAPGLGGDLQLSVVRIAEEGIPAPCLAFPRIGPLSASDFHVLEPGGLFQVERDLTRHFSLRHDALYLLSARIVTESIPPGVPGDAQLCKSDLLSNELVLRGDMTLPRPEEIAHLVKALRDRSALALDDLLKGMLASCTLDTIHADLVYRTFFTRRSALPGYDPGDWRAGRDPFSLRVEQSLKNYSSFKTMIYHNPEHREMELSLDQRVRHSNLLNTSARNSIQHRGVYAYLGSTLSAFAFERMRSSGREREE